MRSTALFLLAGGLFAQHNFTPNDIEDGGRLYRGACVNCHGPDGNLVAGVDLGQNKFRRGSTGDELVKIIRAGIPGTPMPPGNYTDFQAATIVAYLRSLATTGRAITALGDAARGQALFAGKGGCVACHRVKGVGGRSGPELTAIAASRRVVELEKSLLQPDAELLPQNRHYRVVTRSGETILGKLLNLDTFSVQILDPLERLRYFDKANLKEHGFVARSPMPSVEGRLTPQEIADVISYLSTLKGL